ncbi:hypothetical protein EXN66_Car004244 [Channa argus]|uniref:Uncharacterized protein n=1 Tax=Channa argus TaxID=215402 RepID=A0A6G1PEA2_CHAAH|nr:hypothetical protein EXN66_Car004244 [Channa argus]
MAQALSPASDWSVITGIVISCESLLQRWQQLRWRRDWGTVKPQLHVGLMRWLRCWDCLKQGPPSHCWLSAYPTTPSAGCPPT